MRLGLCTKLLSDLQAWIDELCIIQQHQVVVLLVTYWNSCRVKFLQEQVQLGIGADTGIV